MPLERNPAVGDGGVSETFCLAVERSDDSQVHLVLQARISARVGVDARWPRLTARAENHLRDIEWRIGRLGAFVAAGQVDRSLVVERLGVAIELARLDVEVLP